MIQQESEFEVVDNTGVKLIKCFKVLGGSKRRYAHVGYIVIASVREVEPNGSIKKGEVVRAVIVRTKYYIARPDGSKLRFDTNAAVLLDDKDNPRGSRVFGAVARELRERNHLKIVSLAPEVI